MHIPPSLASLVDYGILEDVLRPLMSGKEAQVYLVRSCGEERVAKVYKEAQNRSFRQRAQYTEGRKVRNSRDQRAMNKRSRYGRAQDEAGWRATEVEAIYRLQAAGVRVPVPHHFIDGVLIMELIKDADGDPAPRLGDLTDLSPDEAKQIFDVLLGHVVRMLCAGLVHGDLSDFNVLMAADGPVVIDFPQAVDASSNQNARKLLLRDVDNLHRFVERFTGPHRRPPFAQEMRALYERGHLTPDTKLTGRHRASERKADVKDVLGLIGDAERDERRKREALGKPMPGGKTGTHREARRPVDGPEGTSPFPGRKVMVEVAPTKPRAKDNGNARPGRRGRGRATGGAAEVSGASQPRPARSRPRTQRGPDTPRSQDAPSRPRTRPASQTPAASETATSKPDATGTEAAQRRRRRRRRRRRTPDPSGNR